MENNLEKALVEIITKAIDGVDKSVDFMSVQLPDVIEQALIWHAAESAVYFVMGMALLVFSVWVVCRFGFTSEAQRLAIKQQQAEARRDYENGEPWTLYMGLKTVTSPAYDSVMRKKPVGFGKREAVIC